MKTSTQLKALIRNLSAAKHVEAEVLLRIFLMERLLERIAASKFRKNIILKGGMLIAAMFGIDQRATMDMDTTLKGMALTDQDVAAMVDAILSLPVDDHVSFALQRIEEIREEAEYPGFRVTIEAVFDKIHQPLKVDITTGDAITPREIEFSYPLMFEDRSIRIMAYNPETVLAEKFETILTRGILNTRMRDFYDVHILTSLQDLHADTFRQALGRTMEQRKTVSQMAAMHDTLQRIAASTDMEQLWQRYQSRNRQAENVPWDMAKNALMKLAGIVAGDATQLPSV